MNYNDLIGQRVIGRDGELTVEGTLVRHDVGFYIDYIGKNGMVDRQWVADIEPIEPQLKPGMLVWCWDEAADNNSIYVYTPGLHKAWKHVEPLTKSEIERFLALAPEDV